MPEPDATPRDIALSTPDQVAAAVAGVWAAHQDAGPVLVASDFDGVLSPLVDDPAASRPTPLASRALDELSALDRAVARTALVSGRALGTLALLSGAPTGTILVGSHGSERGVVVRSAPPGHEPQVEHAPQPLSAEQRSTLATLSDELTRITGTVAGAMAEPKPAGVAVHTRRASRADAEQVLEQVLAVGDRLGLHPLRGKDVVEYAVVEASKGQALVDLRDRLDARSVVYLGDDVTDEFAFAALGEHDVSIKVGPGETVAGLRVADPQAAAEVLVRLVGLLRAP